MSSVHLLRGDDESLLGSAVSDLVRRLVAEGDRGLMVEELDGDEYEIAMLVDAAQTAPFLTERRVVLARGVGRFNTDDVKPLVAYLGDPLPSTDLVLVAGGGRLAKSLVDAVKAAGGVIVETDVSSNKKERGLWFDEHVAASGLRLDAAARAMLAEHLGEQSGRLASVLETVSVAFAKGEKISANDLHPFLGEAGSVPPWDLTDAIDRGDTATALTMLTRMTNAGERHPLQVMAILHGHYTRMLRLDGTGARDDKRAAELLGLKSPFQARKAMEQLAKLGDDGLRRAFALLAQADGDLRGAKDWPGELVMEVLVARLSRLAPARSRSPR